MVVLYMIGFINVLIVLVLVFLNGFFVATEFSMVKVRKSRIETLVFEGSRSAKYTQRIVNDLNTYLSACQLGITLASLGLGWVGEPAVSKLLRPIFQILKLSEPTIHTVSIILGFTLITGLHIVLGELVPKSLAIISSERVALITGLPLIVFYKTTYPIIWVFNHSTSLVLRIFGLSQTDEHEAAHSDEEIKLLVEESYKHGLVDQTELTFVDNIFDFSETTVKKIMIPRTDMICIYLDNSFDEIIELAMEEQLTRYPVCRKNKDDIIGFVHIKDLYKLKIQGGEQNIEKIIRDVKFVTETMSIGVLFKVFQKEKEQVAIIIDEYGGTSGLVTIEDILEEIVGEIQDEFDEEGDEISEIEGGSYLVDGKVLVQDINELLDINIEMDNFDTIGGWVYSILDDYPMVDSKVEFGEYEFVISKCDKNRISKIIIKKIADTSEN